MEHSIFEWMRNDDFKDSFMEHSIYEWMRTGGISYFRSWNMFEFPPSGAVVIHWGNSRGSLGGESAALNWSWDHENGPGAIWVFLFLTRSKF